MKHFTSLLLLSIFSMPSCLLEKEPEIPTGFTSSTFFGGPRDDAGYSVQQTMDGGVILLGAYRKSDDDMDMYLVKTNAAGDLIWEKTFGGPGYDLGESVQQTTDGGFILLGVYQKSDDDYYMYLVKTNASGDLIWEKTFGGPGFNWGESVQQTTDGGFILLGSFYNSDDGSDMYLVKTNASGDLIWEKTFGGAGDDSGSSVQQTTDGGFILLGTFYNSDTNYDMYLVKTNADGEWQWDQKLGETWNLEFGYSVRQTTDGGFILFGDTDNGFSGYDRYLIKTDAFGAKTWETTFERLGNDSGNSVQQTSDGGYILSGYISNTYNTDMYLLKISAVGDLQWEKLFGGIGQEVGYSVDQTSDGGFILLGESNSPGASGTDMYLVRTDKDGNIIF